jgi:ABC-type dipeptide/oligopeptide/nickel transport system permease component
VAGFFIRRLLTALLTLFLASLITFSAFRVVIPGDPAAMALGLEATAEQRGALRSRLGLDRSLPAQYLSWVRGFLSGNSGRSLRFQSARVSDLVAERLPVTCALAGLSLFLIILISLPAAVLSVLNEHSFFDRLVQILGAVTIGVPSFFLGILFIWVFGLLLRLFAPGAYVSYKDSAAGFLGCLFFPALAVALPNAAMVMKFLRGSLLHELKSDYVKAASSRGASRGRLICCHALKNAAVPAITLLGMIIGDVFSGSIVIEQVFAIPGLGRLLIAAVMSRDYPLAQALLVYTAFVVVLGNTLAETVIWLMDPRLRA